MVDWLIEVSIPHRYDTNEDMQEFIQSERVGFNSS